MTLNSVLVIDNFPQTLAVVRSLGRAGYNVILAREQYKPVAAYSRYCHENWLHPDRNNPELFETALNSFLDNRPDIQWIFPTSEQGMDLLLNMPSILNRDCTVTMVREELFRACVDKFAANDLATQAGLAVPDSRVVRNKQELSSAASLGYPLIVKSRRTTLRVFGRKAYIIKSQLILDTVFKEWPAEHTELVVQKYVEGCIVSIAFVARNGILQAYCEYRCERTDMLDGTGYCVEFSSVAPTADALAAAQIFVKTHSYRGTGLIQFIRARDTGELYFLENNPRLATGIADGINCGQDFPLRTLQSFQKDLSDSSINFSVGDYVGAYGQFGYWMERDVLGYMELRANMSMQDRIHWLRNMLSSLLRANCHVALQLSDPLPGLKIFAGVVKKIARFAFKGQ